MSIKTKCVFEIVLVDKKQEAIYNQFVEVIKKGLKENEAIKVEISVVKINK